MRPQVPDLTTERSFDSHATWFIGVLGLFFDMLSMGVVDYRTLADVRSTGPGIKSLYRTVKWKLLHNIKVAGGAKIYIGIHMMKLSNKNICHGIKIYYLPKYEKLTKTSFDRH